MMRVSPVFVVALIIPIVSCTGRYEHPPASEETASIFVVDNAGVLSKNVKDSIVFTIADPASCEMLKTVNKEGRQTELRFPIGKPFAITLTYTQWTTWKQCKHTVRMTPAKGNEYLVRINEIGMISLKCDIDFEVRSVGQKFWKRAEPELITCPK